MQLGCNIAALCEKNEVNDRIGYSRFFVLL